jgi:CheY-like chemotaxis protein
MPYMRLGLRILFVLAPVVIALHASAQTADLLPCIDAGASKALSKQRIEEALALQRQHVARFDAIAAGLPAQARFICARGYVGVFLSRLERDSEALAILEPLVEEGRQKLGTDHPDTLNVELLLAMAYGKATRYDAEIKMLQALRPRVAKRYGAKSLEMANVLDSLATA